MQQSMQDWRAASSHEEALDSPGVGGTLVPPPHTCRVQKATIHWMSPSSIIWKADRLRDKLRGLCAACRRMEPCVFEMTCMNHPDGRPHLCSSHGGGGFRMTRPCAVFVSSFRGMPFDQVPFDAMSLWCTCVDGGREGEGEGFASLLCPCGVPRETNRDSSQ